MQTAARYASGWNALLVGRPWREEVPRLQRALDAICAVEGREPASLQRTARVAVVFGNARLVIGGADWAKSGLRGDDPEQLASELRELAGLGISHVQVGIIPWTIDAIERISAVLELLKAPITA